MMDTPKSVLNPMSLFNPAALMGQVTPPTPAQMLAVSMQMGNFAAVGGGGGALGGVNPFAMGMAAQWAPLFAAAAAANHAQGQTNVATDLSTKSSPTASGPTPPQTTQMKPSPFMIASLLEAATQHQQQHGVVAPVGLLTQHSPSSEREANGLNLMLNDRFGGQHSDNDELDDDEDDDGSGLGVGGKKARKARTIFTDKQLQSLEDSFDKQKYLSVQDRMDLANRLCLSDTQVKTWYQNRRTKWKRQTAVGMELLAEAGNFAAVQQILQRATPFWHNAFMAQGGQPGAMPMPPGMPPMPFGGGAPPPPNFLARFAANGGNLNKTSPSPNVTAVGSAAKVEPENVQTGGINVNTAEQSTGPQMTSSVGTSLESPSESDKSNGGAASNTTDDAEPTSRKRKHED